MDSHKGNRVSLNKQGWERVKYVPLSRAIYARNKMNIFINLGRPSLGVTVYSSVAVFYGEISLSEGDAVKDPVFKQGSLWSDGKGERPMSRIHLAGHKPGG